MKHIKSAVIVAVSIGAITSSQAVNVVISGVGDTETVTNAAIVAFIQNNFSNVTSVTYGDYSNPANIPVGTDVFIVGRVLGSAAYDNAGNSLIFNQLTIPVVSLTSYVSRTAGARWSWHSEGATGGSSAGDEITVTAAGASLFGVAADTAVDWFSGTRTFDSSGGGTVGGGSILATIGGNIAVAAWDTGELTAGGTAVGGPRLLFNIPRDGSSGPVYLPDTDAGIAAFRTAISEYTTLNAIPEPSGAVLLLGSVGMLAFRRRRC